MQAVIALIANLFEENQDIPRSTMTQAGLTCMIEINMNKVYLDRICLPKIFNEFVAKTPERHAVFGKF